MCECKEIFGSQEEKEFVIESAKKYSPNVCVCVGGGGGGLDAYVFDQMLL